MSEAKRTHKKKKSGYRKGMLAFFLTLCVVVGLLLVLLWQILARYETTTPRAALDGYFALLSSRNYDQIRLQADFTPSELNSWDDYFLFLNHTFGETPKNLSYRRMSSATGGAASGTASAAQCYAVYSGEEKLGEVALYPDETAPHRWRASAVTTLSAAYTLTAPGHAAVYVNELLLDPAAESVQQQPLEGFESLPEGQAGSVLLRYTVEPTLSAPVFSGTGPDGTPCELAVDDQNHTVSVAVSLSPETQAAYAAAIEAAAKSYATFVTDDNTLGNLQSHLYPNTDLAARMAGFYRGWYLDHEGYDFQNIAVQNIVSTSEDTFTGEITFDYLVYQKGKTHTFPTTYQMYFALYQDQWKLLELQVR